MFKTVFAAIIIIMMMIATIIVISINIMFCRLLPLTLAYCMPPIRSSN